jgi:hypothetical protein
MKNQYKHESVTSTKLNMNSIIRTILFLSAFSPVLLSLAIVRYQISGWSTDVFQLMVIGILGSLIPYLIVRALAIKGEVIAFTAKKIEPNDFVLAVFVFGYISPFVARASGFDIEAVGYAVFAVGVVLWFIQSIPAHPILRLFKIRFYKVEAENGMVYTLISREELRSPTQLKKVYVISSTMLMKAA